MKLRNRILGIFAIVVALAFVVARRHAELHLALRRTCELARRERNHERSRHSLLRSTGRAGARTGRQADAGRRSAARQSARCRAESGGLAHDARLAVHHAIDDRPRRAEGPTRRRRLRRHRRSRRQERHALQARRRSIRRRGRRGRGIRGRSRDPRRRAEARQRDFRAGGLSRRCCTHGAAGPARPRRHQARTESPDQRRVGRRGHVRRADRQALRRRSHRRLQHAQRRAGALARRRSRDRLHAAGLRGGCGALRHHPRQRRESLAVRPATRSQADRHDRHRRRCQGRLARAALATAQGRDAAAVRRSEDGDVHRQARAGGPAVARRADAGRQGDRRSSTGATRSAKRRRRWSISKRAARAARS